MNNVNVDLMGGGNGSGVVADRIQQSGALSIHHMRPYLNKQGVPTITTFKGGDAKNPANYASVPAAQAGLNVNAVTSLRPDEWKQLDQAILDVQKEQLSGYDYIIGKGLTRPLNNPMGTTVLEWHSISDSQSVTQSMDGVTRGEGDAVQYKDNFVPIPILHVDYEINFRKLQLSRNMGEGVETEEASNAGRRIMEKREDLLFGSESVYTYGGGSIYSFFTFPHRNQVTLTKAWDDTTKTPAEIIADVKNMRNANRAKYFTGAQTLFIPDDWADVLDNDYDVSGQSLMTIRERILKFRNIDDIVAVPRMKADNACLVQLTRNVVDIVTGLGVQNVKWDTEGGMVSKHKVMDITVPRLKADFYGKTGIAHLA